MKKYKWHRTEVEKPGYDLTDKPLIGPWELFAVIGIIIFAITLIAFFLKYFTR